MKSKRNLNPSACSLTATGFLGVSILLLLNTHKPINIMILNEVKTAMNSLPETIININSKGDNKDSKRVKSELIKYAIETLLQSYMETHESEDGREILKAKLLLHELSKDL